MSLNKTKKVKKVTINDLDLPEITKLDTVAANARRKAREQNWDFTPVSAKELRQLEKVNLKIERLQERAHKIVNDYNINNGNDEDYERYQGAFKIPEYINICETIKSLWATVEDINIRHHEQLDRLNAVTTGEIELSPYWTERALGGGSWCCMGWFCEDGCRYCAARMRYNTSGTDRYLANPEYGDSYVIK